MDRVTMTIDGMSCGHCVAAVTKALNSVDGVDVQDVSIGKATVAYEPGRVSEEQLRDALEDEGYTVVATQR